MLQRGESSADWLGEAKHCPHERAPTELWLGLLGDPEATWFFFAKFFGFFLFFRFYFLRAHNTAEPYIANRSTSAVGCNLRVRHTSLRHPSDCVAAATESASR